MVVDNIANLCKAHSITFAQLEREVGIGNGVIGRWAKHCPSLSNLQKVANYFHCSIDTLIKEAVQHQD